MKCGALPTELRSLSNISSFNTYGLDSNQRDLQRDAAARMVGSAIVVLLASSTVFSHFTTVDRNFYFNELCKYTLILCFFKIYGAGVIGLEPTTVGLTGRCSQPIIATLPYFVVRGRVELPTHGFSVHCSTT